MKKMFLLVMSITPLLAMGQELQTLPLQLPIDKAATRETIHLLQQLQIQRKKGYMFGHQDDLAYGVHWKYEKGRSDVKEACGDYPAVYGWELGHLELDSTQNLDGVPFDKMIHYIQEGYERGGVITISWHFTNALTGKSAWDAVPGTVAAILPGGIKHDLYKSWLNKLAAFMQQLKSKKGVFIPVIFRPFHELNGSWFWWGKNHCTPEELIQLYQFTARYLMESKNIHHLLYAFNTDRFSSKEEYLERFPGNDWVDVIGFDIYQRNNNNASFINEVDKSLTLLEGIANEKNKVPALTEFGYNELPDANWWTSTFLKAIGDHQISYVLGWRNAGKKSATETEFYVPFKEHASVADFKKFYSHKRTLFQKEVTKINLYRKQ